MKPANIQLLDILHERLGNIRQANGYYNTIEAIHRTQSDPWVIDVLPVLNYWPTGLTNLEHRHRIDIRTLSVSIGALAQVYEQNFTDTAEALVTDVITALNRHPDAPKVSDAVSLNFGNTVSSFNYLAHEYLVSKNDEPWAGALISVEIVYKAKQNDLYNFEQ